MRFYSIIVPVYNRPDEIGELLESISRQAYINFEVLIIEDGSSKTCKHVIDKFADRLEIHYFFKENSGQGFSRNYGFEKAKGDYFIVFDSDCILPPSYLKTVDDYLNQHYLDAFGGPDKADASFTEVQKAINYSMTSVFTTGGIRGSKKHAGTFHPRSFNMGISRQVYEKTSGYIITRMGEDIEFSIRIIRQGFKVGLIEGAFVYHKRRTSLGQFYKQLHFFGRARINVSRFHSGEIKIVNLLPLLFFLGMLGLILWWFVYKPFFYLGVVLLVCYYALILIDSTKKNKNLAVGILSVLAAIIQLSAYAIGMITEFFRKGNNQAILSADN